MYLHIMIHTTAWSLPHARAGNRRAAAADRGPISRGAQAVGLAAEEREHQQEAAAESKGMCILAAVLSI